MSANERIPDALQDFEACIMEGFTIDEAIKRAAEDNKIKPEILRKRAERTLGDLDFYVSRLIRQVEITKERQERLQPLKSLIEKLYSTGKPKGLVFIPIGHYIRTNFSNPAEYAEALSFAQTYQRSVKANISNK